MASEHVAHPCFHGHGFSVGASGLVGDGQGVGEGVLGERIRVQLPLELQKIHGLRVVRLPLVGDAGSVGGTWTASAVGLVIEFSPRARHRASR
jgi:hypothetical protein